MQAWLHIGPHRYYTESDVVFWCMSGVMDEAHIEQLLAAVDAVLLQFRHSVLLVDCTNAHSLSAGARRRYADWLKQSHYPHRASLFFSVSEEMRPFLLLAKRGGQLLANRISQLAIVKDEPAACQYVDELRAQWALE